MMRIDDSEFYNLIKFYFMEMAEAQRVVIAPMFGQRANVPISKTVYFEYMNDRIINICSYEDENYEERFRISNFEMYGKICKMLTLQTHCSVEELSELWNIRRGWIETGIEPKI